MRPVHAIGETRHF